MNRLVAVTGSTGVGKTTLVRALCQAHPFAAGLEQHVNRPFQALFEQDTRFALANQLDYFLLRAEQEQALRSESATALVDGGLEQDFYGFTHVFHERGLISAAELGLLQRLYQTLRRCLPPPDLVIHLQASEAAIRERLAGRARINIASAGDIAALAAGLERWLVTLPPDRLIRLDVTHVRPDYADVVAGLLEKVRGLA